MMKNSTTSAKQDAQRNSAELCKTSEAESSPSLDRLARERDSWKEQALRLVGVHSSLLRLLNAVAIDGSRIVAESPGLAPAERRKLLDTLGSLYVPVAELASLEKHAAEPGTCNPA